MANFLSAVILLTAYAANIHAKDLGSYGHVFPIKEQSLLDLLRVKLSNLTEHQLCEFHQKVQNHYVAVAYEPIAVSDITQARCLRTYDYDPTIRVVQDVQDHLGRVIIAKGTCINPLDTHPLNADLLIFDGSNATHVQWARAQSSTALWILIKGRPIELEAQEKRPVYFDQFGVLCQKLAIRAVPARVTQVGLKLKIEEIPLEDACFSTS